jgi:hypothetical protein
VLEQRLHDLLSVGEPEATGALAVGRDGREDPLLALLPEPRELRDVTLLRHALQVVERLHAELAPQLLRLLGAHTGQAGQLDEREGDLLGQLVEQRQPASRDQLGDVTRHVLADRGELGEVGFIVHHLAEWRGVRFDGAGRILIGADAEGIGAFDLQQYGNVLQDACDLEVLHLDVAALGAHELYELLLGERLHPEALRVAELGAWVLAYDHEGGFLAHRRGHPPAE